MRMLKLIVSFLLLYSEAKTQKLLSNTCDSTVLTKIEMEWCRNDSIYKEDILEIINYITFLKTNVLPRYRSERKALIFSADTRKLVKQLRNRYDSTLNHKIQFFAASMDRNQKYLQPKAYIGSLLMLEICKFYPDIYAILLNPIHITLQPKTDPKEISVTQILTQKLFGTLSPTLIQQLSSQSQTLLKNKKAYNSNTQYEVFRGEISDEQRNLFEALNYLLWTE